MIGETVVLSFFKSKPAKKTKKTDTTETTKKMFFPTLFYSPFPYLSTSPFYLDLY